jgi:beta-phosphoglucomutase-like phosphatase (HAD superfamily)
MDLVNKFDLFIFDLDDTLVLTENYHYFAWYETIKYFSTINNKQSNLSYFTYDFFISIFHCINENTAYDFLKSISISRSEAQLFKDNLYFDLIEKDKQNIKMLNGASEMIEHIIDNNKRFVIVTNSKKQNLDFMLELFPILKKSSKNYYKEIIMNKKPNPECYYTVVNDFPNLRYIGFEDSITGIHAISQVKDIIPIFINRTSYYHFNYITQTYPIIHINNYNDLEICFNS